MEATTLAALSHITAIGHYVHLTQTAIGQTALIAKTNLVEDATISALPAGRIHPSLYVKIHQTLPGAVGK